MMLSCAQRLEQILTAVRSYATDGWRALTMYDLVAMRTYLLESSLVALRCTRVFASHLSIPHLCFISFVPFPPCPCLFFYVVVIAAAVVVIGFMLFFFS